MSDRPIVKARAKRSNASESGYRDASSAPSRRSGDILGLQAFEKISAVEGIRLTDEMRQDLRSLGAQHKDQGERSRFILAKYGKQ